ncbi:MAG: type II toxin-antitoxin system RelE/ParE family toxin [Spirochaetales bacterium]|nr:type II toxin-antitoxin system RelE/ParE family toxin [Spirochaetales bacterium]
MPSFEKHWINGKLTDEHLKELEVLLCEHPDMGALIAGTGGLRKLRWALPGKGKSGSIRVLYIDFAHYEQIYMVTCFKKKNKENLTQDEKNQIKSMINKIKANLRQFGHNQANRKKGDEHGR